jgi:hypothetical protein
MHVIAFLIPLVLIICVMIVGAPEVRELRRLTGDKSWITYVLGFEFLRRK